MKTPMLETMRDAAKSVLLEEFGDDTGTFCPLVFGQPQTNPVTLAEYHAIEWSRICTKLVSRMSSSVFVGQRLAHDARWQAIVHSYTFNLFNACRVLRTWPAVLRPIAVWFIKEARLCRAQIAEARKIVASDAPDEATESTAFAWMDARADPAVIQLALAAGALQTTSQLLNQALLDLAYAGNQGQDIIGKLRSECQDCDIWTDGSVSPSTLPKMVVLEACLKETQRLKPQTMTNLDRLALRPVTLPNGLRLPKGTMVSVDQSVKWEKQTWGEDAMAWNPLHWITYNETGGAEFSGPEKLTNSSDRHFAFGKGRFICPGRFLVNGELKVALSMILERWDVRLSEQDHKKVVAKGEGRVPWVPYGFEMLADESLVVEVRKLE
jgi:cytochrome P450